MKYINVAALVSCVTTLVSAQGTKETKYNQVESLKNKISDYNLIVRYHEIRSKVSCAKECSHNDQCTSFFYNKIQHFCRLHSQGKIRLGQTTDMEGTMFFRLWKDHSGEGYTFNKTIGIWYKWYNLKLIWTSAVKHCEKDGAVLISPITKTERELVEFLKHKGYGVSRSPWIGCWKKKDDWVWLDGTAVVGTSWYPGQPRLTHSKCCVLSTFKNIKMKWSSASCDSYLPFACEISL